MVAPEERPERRRHPFGLPTAIAKPTPLYQEISDCLTEPKSCLSSLSSVVPCPTVNLTRIPLICLRSRRQVANRSSRLLNWCCCPPVRCGQTTREATGQPDLNFLGARHQPPDAVTDERHPWILIPQTNFSHTA
ncbi:hypothetical protein VTJ04DRAFT_10680 [Mycothermus thermophilus]|uniref:uncharacterized protein n=1 Tax=Humicola insolens TaxID=85995 RepID=UPI003742B1C2